MNLKGKGMLKEEWPIILLQSMRKTTQSVRAMLEFERQSRAIETVSTLPAVSSLP
jgi:hypothetical protein